MKKKISLMTVLCLMLSLVMPFSLAANEGDTKEITILGTSDLHGRIFPWDYALDVEDSDAGYLKISSVVKEIRATHDNVILVDAGDTIQDNSIELFQDEDQSPIIEVMNDLNYDVWTIGNHEFNFGLDQLGKAVETSNATVLAGNVYKTDGTRAYDAYKIVEKDGVRVALIGMVTPNIPRWEASSPDHFEGLEFRNPAEETTKVIKELEGKADVFIGVFHMGLENEYTDFDGTETVIKANPELTAVVMGHAHSDIEGEMVGNTLVVEPKRYGNRVSKIDLSLKFMNGKWQVVDKKSENINTKAYDVDEALAKKYEYIHKTSQEDANLVIGTIMRDYVEKVQELPGIPTAQIKDTAIIDLINEVQLEYSGADVSAAAAFKSDMNLLQGDFKKKDVANIYKYANTLMAVKMNGEQLKDYMEWSAKYYNTYKPGDVTISFNPDVRGYNYDMFAGVEYDIDISQPAGSRIKNLTFKGEPVTKDTELVVAINNYRCGNMLKDGYFNKEDIVYDSALEYPDGSIRALIIDYVKKNKTMTPKVDNNWKVIGTAIDPVQKAEVYKLVEEGVISIPKSEDGRTPNVKSLNIYELQEQGYLTATTCNGSTQTATESDCDTKTYTVVSGDVLWQIAEKYNTTWEKLAELNHMDNPNLIMPDQQIVVPVV